MTFDSFIDSRQVFSLKADLPVSRLRHDIIVRGNLIYRYSLIDDLDFGMIVESQVIDRVLKMSIPAIPVAVDTDENETFQFMRRARGQALAELTSEQKAQIWPDLAANLRKLHAIPGDGFGLIVDGEKLRGYHLTWIDYIYSNLLDEMEYAVGENLIGGKEVTEIASIVTHIITESVQGVLLHGDLNDHNIFAQDGKISDIIDWEDAIIGDPIFDLANWACFTAHSRKDWDILFRAYFSGDIPPGFWRRFWIYHVRLSLSRLVYLHKAKFESVELAQKRLALGIKEFFNL